MTGIRTRIGTLGAMTAIAVSGLGFAPPAHADAQYKADRAYCMSGQASEARDLCLKEAAAAQADRQSGSRGAAQRAHRKPRSQAAASPATRASAP